MVVVAKAKRFIRRYILKRPVMQDVSLKKREKLLKEWFLQRRGRMFDLENPTTFTEKLQWMKLYYKHPNLLRCVDKYEFKEYVAEKLGEGYTAPLIQVWDCPEAVSIRDIPEEKFVIKSTLQSDGKFICLVTDKSKIDINEVEKEIKDKWFDRRRLLTNSFCSAYYGAKPRVIVEAFVEEFANCANDYKLFCFHGEPAFFYVAEDHFKDGENSEIYPITFFDLQWNRMDVKYGEHNINEKAARPYHAEEMIALARKLSADFPFVRVDFFDTPDKLYLAELTFYPGGGATPYYPESFDEKMGSMLNLP